MLTKQITMQTKAITLLSTQIYSICTSTMLIHSYFPTNQSTRFARSLLLFPNCCSFATPSLLHRPVLLGPTDPFVIRFTILRNLLNLHFIQTEELAPTCFLIPKGSIFGRKVTSSGAW